MFFFKINLFTATGKIQDNSIKTIYSKQWLQCGMKSLNYQMVLIQCQLIDIVANGENMPRHEVAEAVLV